MAQIFFSYARADARRVTPIIKGLEAEGYSVWWDDGLRSGANWEREILRQLELSKAVVVAWSRTSVTADWVLQEARYGREKSILCPVMVERATIPWPYDAIHYETLIGWTGDRTDRRWRLFLEAVAAKAGQPENPPPPPPDDDGIKKPIPTKKKPSTPDRPVWPGIVWMFGILLVIGTGLWAYWVSQRPNPDRVFADCDGCPEMVVIPAGRFTMGSPENEAGRESDEGPQRPVSVPRFALGRTEVTFAQWDACVADGYCRPITADRGWGRGNRPVINVSWNDITGETVSERGFLAWMNAKVDGAPYRLPSEAEWEYAARASTTTRFWWGDEDPVCTAGARNGAQSYQCEPRQTQPVGRFTANPFGLFDVHGNVWEWVQDCWHGNYNGAPTDGSAWMAANGGDCSGSVLRGGSWGSDPRNLRSANRGRIRRTLGNYSIGFRLARTLP